MRRALPFLIGSALALAGCATTMPEMAVPGFATPQLASPFGPGRAPPPEEGGFVDIGYATWTNEEPAYLLYPGDELELVVPAAPDYNRVLTVQPDGRVRLPLVGDVMTAGRPVGDIEQEAFQRYATQLRNPRISMSVTAAPLTVYVGGEVGSPGAYGMVGDQDALQAIIQAGGFSTGANRRQVIIIRRGRSGSLMMRTADLADAFRHGDQPDLVPLARGDIIYVPRSGLVSVGMYVQQFITALPVSFSYAINGYGG